jgi:hypothetical protein
MVLHCETVLLPKFIDQPTLGLIAGMLVSVFVHRTLCHLSIGCYVHDGWLPVSVFYKWLDRIIDLKENGQLCLITDFFTYTSNGT